MYSKNFENFKTFAILAQNSRQFTKNISQLRKIENKEHNFIILRVCPVRIISLGGLNIEVHNGIKSSTKSHFLFGKIEITRINTNVSYVMEFLAWCVLKSKIFAQKSTAFKWNCCILWIDIVPGPQKVPKLYFQSQFSMSKINRIFSKKKFI